MNHDITNEVLTEFSTAFSSNPVNRIAMNAVTSAGLLAASKNPMAQRESRHSYSISLEQGEITNQKQSGRCWMFAALNTFRFEVMKNLNLKTFELSQNYTLFYDKLEKSNYFLESILETLDEPTQGRLISFLLSAPLGDGGQWDMLCNLVRKYGVVPKEAMPETVSSSATREMTSALTRKLREDACRLRKAYTNLTGTAFFEKYVGLNLDDYVSLINAPTADKPYHRSYSVKFLGNVKEGCPVRYLNLPIEELKKAAIAQMKDGSPVWFGCDVGKDSSRDEGLLDTNTYQTDKLLGVTFGMNKAERLEYGESLMTHAMVFQGVNLDEEGKPNRWRVENSWGDAPGKKGYYVMSDEWFDEYMYQIVVNKKYLPDSYIAEYDSEPIMLEPWDPMGSLAL